MKISTKGRYGARAMLELACNYDKRRIPAYEIAERQGLSLKYLEALLASLKSAGLVTSEKGRSGGYSLARPPSEITMWDVLSHLENSLCIVHCTGDENGCERRDVCATREVWIELKEATERVLQGRTLQDLCERKDCLETKECARGSARAVEFEQSRS